MLLLDMILELPLKHGSKEKLRDEVVRFVNHQYAIKDFWTCQLFAGILPFRCNGFPVTSKTSDLVKCLVPELIQLPPYCDNADCPVESVSDFVSLIFDKFHVS